MQEEEMSPVNLIATVLAVVAAGCSATDEPEAPQLHGLRLFDHHPTEISGTFAGHETTIDFTVAIDGTARHAIIRTADGHPLVEVTHAGGVETLTYLGRYRIVSTSADAPRVAGDPTTLSDLAAMPEVKLIEPMREALASAGVRAELYADIPNPERTL